MSGRNGFKPAFAGITYNGEKTTKKERDGVTFSTSEANDFNSFSSSSKPKKGGRSPKKDTTIEINLHSLIITVVSILAAIILIVFISIIISAANKNIKYSNNTFLCYEDSDGNYVVLKNGKPIRDVFADKTTLVPASDNSFAYITVETSEGIDVYLLDGSRAKLICDNAKEIQAYAEFEPALVYIKDERSVYYYDGAETIITSGSGTASNVVISPDASAVAYIAPSRSKPDVSALFVYTAEAERSEEITANAAPISVSNKGKYVLAHTADPKDTDKKDVYAVVDLKASYRINSLNGYFGEVLYKNSNETEIVFTTVDENGQTHTYVLDCNKLSAKKSNTAYYLGTGKSVPQVTNKKIVRLDTVKKSYFRNVEELKTFYVNKKYEKLPVADFIGEFDPELKYFYFINTNETDKGKDRLCRMEISNGKAKSIKVIYSDVKSFCVTEKGNVYYLDIYFDLYFYKNSQDKSTRVANGVENIQFYTYKNTVYFDLTDADDVTAVYSSTEGSDRELVKFGDKTTAEIPVFTNSYSKYSYAYYEDSETGDTVICYTSNGKTFKKAATTANLVTK